MTRLSIEANSIERSELNFTLKATRSQKNKNGKLSSDN